MGNVRDMFPGGNTSEGFYSYYQYILGQTEASTIICLKGGPGTGKSSLMKDIGTYFSEKGEDVDYFWCSSDPDSLDGVLLRQKKIAVLDGTSPHIVDPQNPGAVDTILHLGEYWNGEVIRQYKSHIMQSNQKIRRWFGYAYNSLKGASALMDSITCTYNEMMTPGELYREGAGIINRELSRHPITLSEGKRKKYFASAITPKGLINHLPSIIKGYETIYCFMAPVGFRTDSVLKTISENTVHRGFITEEFYCPMMPGSKIEHLLIPELSLAFITLNPYHDMDTTGLDAEIKTLEMCEFIDWNRTEPFMDTIRSYEEQIGMLINQTVGLLKKAKAEHDLLESFYIPNMNFQKIEELKTEIIGKIERNVL